MGLFDLFKKKREKGGYRPKEASFFQEGSYSTQVKQSRSQKRILDKDSVSKESGHERAWQPGQVWPKGKEIERLYRIEGILGEGGMGIVYMALDLSHRDKSILGEGGMDIVKECIVNEFLSFYRQVVIKSLRSDYARDENRKRLFMREAEEWIKIGVHPNIIRAYDVREIEGIPMIIAEYADSYSLDTHLSHGLLPMEKALDIAIQICWGMAFAHDKNLAHRDLKPNNIFLTRDGPVKVADFGLVKRVDEVDGRRGDTIEPEAMTELTIGVMGTPPYMAPEQWQGRAGKEADIYSLGVILYELFCGKRPFDFSDAHPAARAYHYQKAHMNDRPPKPKELRSGLPSLLSDLMLRCLEKKPSKRPGDFRAIAKALDQISREYFHKPLPPEPNKEEVDRQARLDQAWALVRLGKICQVKGDLDKALRLMKDALEIFQSLKSFESRIGLDYNFPMDSWDEIFFKLRYDLDADIGILECYDNMGLIFAARGEYDRARQMYEETPANIRKRGHLHQIFIFADLKQKYEDGITRWSETKKEVVEEIFRRRHR